MEVHCASRAQLSSSCCRAAVFCSSAMTEHHPPPPPTQEARDNHISQVWSGRLIFYNQGLGKDSDMSRDHLSSPWLGGRRALERPGGVYLKICVFIFLVIFSYLPPGKRWLQQSLWKCIVQAAQLIAEQQCSALLVIFNDMSGHHPPPPP